MAKIGRPPKRPVDRRSVTLTFRVTKAEADKLRTTAQRAKLSLGESIMQRLRERR